ncbi:hypothetical protein [Mesorhizobium onobrychidis]|uniref:Uncharacterized protein n=1 Tax=Mesorhizobium onobrychidis TaxID=2775404 RepID=A0ABY5QXL9_9HYPH|nr:hypothetical protein [Mesorhizobium onobrychidis]UVC15414.1 hypothetical protein IHQ72_34020 [Mesorhizobium onobrychidis]
MNDVPQLFGWAVFIAAPLWRIEKFELRFRPLRINLDIELTVQELVRLKRAEAHP